MLVLSRHRDESIMIGDGIEVSILSVSGDKVRIGIDAPRDIAVFRKEVYEARDGGGPATDGAAPSAAADGSAGSAD